MNEKEKLEFSHLDSLGKAKMVDISEKRMSAREARAIGYIYLSDTVYKELEDNTISKGDVFTVAKVAGIQGAKQTGSFIPLCHPLNIDFIDLSFKMDKEHKRIAIESHVKIQAGTGVEMEALTAVSIAALTLYDMCKSLDKSMMIGEIRLLEKHGGKSGSYLA